MTIDKAIEVLNNKVQPCADILPTEGFAAIALGIEALKLYKDCGHPARCGMLTRLPGETE